MRKTPFTFNQLQLKYRFKMAESRNLAGHVNSSVKIAERGLHPRVPGFCLNPRPIAPTPVFGSPRMMSLLQNVENQNITNNSLTTVSSCPKQDMQQNQCQYI